jgi:integrase
MKTSLRDFSCADGDELLASIARDHRLRRATFYRIKSFLSGTFSYAKRKRILDRPNPMQGVSIPTAAKPAKETYAYSLEEIQRMLAELPELAKTVLAVAGFAGLSRSELRGLRWEDYRDASLRVSRSVWRRHVLETKTPYRNAAVPVIPLLGEILDRHRGSLRSGPVFLASNGQPLNLDNLARRIIIPVLRVSNMEWHGWHALRRVLATNLHRLGVPDETIRSILRHANVRVTQDSYIKTVPADAVAAMAKMERVLRERRVPTERGGLAKCATSVQL